MDYQYVNNLIQLAEKQAYYSVLRAFRFQSNGISWEKEFLLTDLRDNLRISNDDDVEIHGRLNDDETLSRIRNAIRESRSGQTGSGSSCHQHGTRTGQTGSGSSHQHASQCMPQPVHDALHKLTKSTPCQKKLSIRELLEREDTIWKGEDPCIPYRNQYASGQGHDDGTAGAGTINRVNFEVGGTSYPSPRSFKGKRIADITFSNTDLLINKGERAPELNPRDSLEVERKKKLLNEQENALFDGNNSLEDDSDDD